MKPGLSIQTLTKLNFYIVEYFLTMFFNISFPLCAARYPMTIDNGYKM
jgi:hypothetical protein